MILSMAPNIWGRYPVINNFGTGPTDFNGKVTTGATSADWSSWGTLYSNLPVALSGFEIADVDSFFSTNNNTNAAALIEISYVLSSERRTIVEAMPMGGATVSRNFYFPIFIPEGATVEWRIRSVRTGLSNVQISFVGIPSLGGFGVYRPFGGCKCFGLDTANLRGTLVSESTGGSYTTPSISMGSTDVDINAVRLLPHWQGNILTTNTTFYGRIQRGVDGPEIYRIFYRSETAETVRSISSMQVGSLYVPSGTELSVGVTGLASGTDLYYVVQGFYYSL